MRIGLATGIALAVACFAAPAHAQFTAAVVPPERVVQPDTTNRKDSVQKARVALQERMSSMKAWVDSVSLAMASTPDSARAESTAAAAAVPAARAESTVASGGEVAPAESGATSFRPGAPAPSTATPLPLLVLAGTVLVGAGALLLKR
ncbi:MAG TPA: hypothetical protein VFS44_12620 [Gemmatimonadaceae bacterium]|nr:hypothetical protein [Gemmatimonadaceae bacterium]